MGAPAPRKRTLVDKETGDVFEATETYKGQVAYNFRGRYTPTSDTLMVRILSKESGLKPSDKEVLLLHIHGSDDDGVLRMVQQAMADFIGIKLRTVSGSMTRLRKAALLIVAEKHGRVTYYRVTPHLSSREGGEAQRKTSEAYRYPVLPGQKESA